MMPQQLNAAHGETQAGAEFNAAKSTKFHFTLMFIRHSQCTADSQPCRLTVCCLVSYLHLFCYTIKAFMVVA
jgi:Na+/H+ antiporter NhaB